MSATEALREELAHVEVSRTCCNAAELSALLRLGGTVTLSESGLGLAFASGSGAVTRRARSLLEMTTPVRQGRIVTTVEVHRPGGLRRSSRYRLVLTGDVAPLLNDLGILEDNRRLSEGIALALVRPLCDTGAYVRGALMAAGTVSDPDGPPHLEIRTTGGSTAEGLARLLRRCGARGSRAVPHHQGWRVVVKSGAEIGALMARAGAHATFLRWDTARMHRELRSDANRAANAVRANVSRAVAASVRHVAQIEQTLAGLDWSSLPEELQQVALARLANPEASLAELGALLDPPVGKATVHRRLARLNQSFPAAGDSPAHGRGESKET